MADNRIARGIVLVPCLLLGGAFLATAAWGQGAANGLSQLRADQQQGRFGAGAPQTPNWIWLTEAEGLQDVPEGPWQQARAAAPGPG